MKKIFKICSFQFSLTILFIRNKEVKNSLKTSIIATVLIVFLSDLFANNTTYSGVFDMVDVNISNTCRAEAIDVENGERVPTDDMETDFHTDESQIIYSDNMNINSFILAYNNAYPDDAKGTNDLSKYYHHGREHDDQVITTINGVRVIISSEMSHKLYNVSVYWDNPTKNKPEGNIEMFHIIMHVFAPSLTEEQITDRWQETIDALTHRVEWEDGIEFWPGSSYGKPDGAYEYIKICG